MPAKRRTTTTTTHVTLDGSDSFNSSSRLGTREDEKEFLGSLNSRLATYIDRVRHLEQENNRLTVQIKDIEIVERKEKDNLAHRYEAETERLRKQYEYNAGRLAKLEIERDTAVAARDELEALVARLEQELNVSESRRQQAESLSNDYHARLQTAEGKNKTYEAENADLKKENDRLRKQLAALKKSLEDENVLRAELQNKLHSAKEELEFERGNHRQQLEDVRRKRQVEMTTISKQLETDYENRLNAQLDAMREDFANRLAANRATFEEQYKNKLNDASDMAERFRDEAYRLRVQVSDLEKSNQGVEGQIDAMRRKISGLESEMEKLRHSKDERIYELNNEIQRMMQEYQDLCDTKIQFEMELKAYQALLEGEETRLNLSHNASNASSRHVSFSTTNNSASRGVKRRRLSNGEDYDFTHQRSRFVAGTAGDISFENADEEGKSITIKNNGAETVSLGGWELRVTTDDREVVYKFNPKLVLRSNNYLTIWSANSGQKHNPPSDLVMKNQNWPVGASPEAVIVDGEGERQAWMEAVHDTSYGDKAQDRCCIM
ncbi:unnamed protein product, partial [Mesorhabditis spiculigera]